MHLEAKHYLILAAMLASVGTQLGGLEHGWADAMTPQFVGGLLFSMGTTVAAVFVGAPIDRNGWQDMQVKSADDTPAPGK